MKKPNDTSGGKLSKKVGEKKIEKAQWNVNFAFKYTLIFFNNRFQGGSDEKKSKPNERVFFFALVPILEI